MVLVASASTLHDAHVADLDHHLEGARIEEIADQHRRGVAEGGVGGVAPAAQARLVDHVVVQQGRGMDEFQHRREVVQRAFLAAVAGGAGARAAAPPGRSRLPPEATMYCATSRTSGTSDSRRRPMTSSTRRMSSATGASMDTKLMIRL